jgi:NitT/TauT family transport system substrate-binding protein
MKLTIGHLSTFYHTAILLMPRRGLSGLLGADVGRKLFGTGPAIVNAMERGEINLAYLGLPPAIKMKMNEMIRTCFRTSRI